MRLINTANINYVVYKEHEEYLWLVYHPAKNSKWFKLFDHDEYWKCPWSRDYYTREEVLMHYPEYMINDQNRVVRRSPILYIHFVDGTSIEVKIDAKFVYDTISKMKGQGVISIV